MTYNRLLVVIIVLMMSTFSSFAQQKDRDGDGLPDSRDQCPKKAGLVDNNGCPADSIAPNPSVDVDSDGDTVPDKRDQCPDLAGYAEWGGCPDDDADGLTNQYDKCPFEYGSRENSGCPDLLTVAPQPTVAPTARPLPPLPQDGCYVATAGATAVNIRPDTSTDNAPIGVLNPYQVYSALGLIDGWVQLTDEGYVFQGVVRVSDSCTEITRASDSPSNPAGALKTANDATANDGYICVYFTGLFQNSSNEEEVLFIELTDALGEGSSNHIGPARIPAGATYYAEKHFLVPDDWQIPAHPEAGWNIIYQASDENFVTLQTQPFDFSLVGEVDFMITFREDCTSPQPTCYYATTTVMNHSDSAAPIFYGFLFSATEINFDTFESDFMNGMYHDINNFTDGLASEFTPAGQATHNLYALSSWHYSATEHLGYEPALITFYNTEMGFDMIDILDTSEVQTVPIESLEHLCESNPVQDNGLGGANGLANDPDSQVCYYFEQSFNNHTNLSIPSPTYQLLVWQSSFPHILHQTIAEPFSTTIFSNGDKLQHLQYASRFGLIHDDENLYVEATMLDAMPEGLSKRGPSFLTIVDDSYCDSGTMPFTQEEVVTQDPLCYMLEVVYNNTTPDLVEIPAKLFYASQEGIEPISEWSIRTWKSGEYDIGYYVFIGTQYIEPAGGNYVFYQLDVPPALEDLLQVELSVINDFNFCNGASQAA